jgi:hypothetical protein
MTRNVGSRIHMTAPFDWMLRAAFVSLATGIGQSVHLFLAIEIGPIWSVSN